MPSFANFGIQMWVHPRHIHYLFTVKGATMPIAAFSVFGWCLTHGGGIGALTIATQAAKETKLDIPLGWSIMSGINVIMGSLSPMVVNQPDLARFCKNSRDAGPLQGVSVFVSSVIVFFLGLASTTSIQKIWGVAYWNIWDLLDAILDHYWNPGARVGIFFIALAFLLGVFATNFGANSIPFGSDVTALFPKYLTIRRGQALCAILGVAVVPWKLIASASAFLSFLGSYNIFMAPLCAVIVGDYIFVRRGNIHVPSLYDGSKKGLYWYWSGINWVGAFSWLAGTAMGIPGLIGQYRPDITSVASSRMYMMGWILTYVTAAIVHFIATRFWKAKVFPNGRENTPFQREWLANWGREGYYEGEREGEIFAPPVLPGNEVDLGHIDETDAKDDKAMMAYGISSRV
jgi:NCS1 family nucleobase:cation symporter-1